MRKCKIESCDAKHKGHGFCQYHYNHSRYISPEYNTWASMRKRCYGAYHKSYKDYGGRGITVCDRWLGKKGFSNFIQDMGSRPVGTSLDRINNEGNYEPSNCRWATRSEQQNNKRPTKISTYSKYNSTGINGVYIKGNRFISRYKDLHLGEYGTIEEAISMRLMAENVLSERLA